MTAMQTAGTVSHKMVAVYLQPVTKYWEVLNQASSYDEGICFQILTYAGFIELGCRAGNTEQQ